MSNWSNKVCICVYFKYIYIYIVSIVCINVYILFKFAKNKYVFLMSNKDPILIQNTAIFNIWQIGQTQCVFVFILNSDGTIIADDRLTVV